MSKVDKTKESIGYLKVILSIFVAVDISMLALLYKNYNDIVNIEVIMIFLLGDCEII